MVFVKFVISSVLPVLVLPLIVFHAQMANYFIREDVGLLVLLFSFLTLELVVLAVLMSAQLDSGSIATVNVLHAHLNVQPAQEDLITVLLVCTVPLPQKELVLLTAAKMNSTSMVLVSPVLKAAMVVNLPLKIVLSALVDM